MSKKETTLKQIEFISGIAVVFIMIAGAFISYFNHNVAAVLIMIGALTGFCVIWYKSKNLFNFLGLMYLGFIFPLGMANLRWANYQKEWTFEAWLCFITAAAAYIVGYLLKDIVVKQLLKNKSFEKLSRKSINYDHMFIFGILVFICFLSGFFIKWWVAGSLPLFNWQGAQTYVQYLSGEEYLDILKEKMSDLPILFMIIKAYHRFSTIFMFQGWLASCAVYAFCVKCKPKMWKRIISWSIIVISIIIPYVIVVREIFMMQTVAFAVFAYMIHQNQVRRYLIVTAMAIITVLGFVGMSKARGFTQNQIAEVFEMNETDEAEEVEKTEKTDDKNQEKVITTKYPATVIWVYTYFTCGYDNFNYLTQKLDYHTYGLMELRPVFSALQINGLKDVDMKLQDDKYRVSPNITIYTFLCDAYVDFGIPGVFFSMIIWGLVFGMIAEVCICFKGAVSTILYGGIGHHIIFMAFVSWMGHFSYLCSFGLLFIYFVISLIEEKRSEK